MSATRTFGVVTSHEAVAGFGTWDRYVDFTDDLDSGETLSSPEVTTDDDGISISDVAVNTSTITDDSWTVAVGKAVQFRVTTDGTVTTGTATLTVAAETSDNNRKAVTAYQPIADTDTG